MAQNHCLTRRRVLATAAAAAIECTPLLAASAQTPSLAKLSYHTPKLDKAVEEFKRVFGSHSEYFELGQFYVTRVEIRRLFEQVGLILRGDPIVKALTPDAAEALVKSLVDPLIDLFAKGVQNVQPADAIRLIDQISGPISTAKDLKALFAPGPSQMAWAKASYEVIWGNDLVIAGVPLFGGSPTLVRAKAAYEFEKDMCFRSANSIARKIQRKLGVRAPSAGISFRSTFLSGAKPLRRANLDTIVYASPSALAADVVRIRSALNASVYVLCGVLSGMKQDMAVFPKPEHYLLLFGHDTIDRKDVFAFWDSDTERSHISETDSWGAGFGGLVHADGHFSTAFNAADLATIDARGDHFSLTRRHRYQVFEMRTIP